MELWYKHYGFNYNPFTIKPGIVSDQLIGQQETIDKITHDIAHGQILIIKGKYGAGKSTYLKSVIKKFAGRKKVIYYSCNRLEGKLDVDRLLHERFGVLGRLLRLKTRNMILLLDEASYLSKNDFKKVKQYHDKGYFKSVVYVTYRTEDMPKHKTYTFQELGPEQAIDLARKRIGDLKLISDAMLKRVYQKSPSTRVFLKNCEDVCRYAYEQNHKRVMSSDINKAVRATI